MNQNDLPNPPRADAKKLFPGALRPGRGRASLWLPGPLRPGKTHHAGATESALLWSTRKLELQAMQGPPAACRAAWSLSSVDGESTHP